ncbi:hypothetical protein LINGRAHAP2_LOCUS8453 [Linum grandiflorum]
MGTSIAKVIDYLVKYTPTVHSYTLRHHVTTKDATSYGYAYCYSTVPDCHACLIGLVGELGTKCLNANQAQASTSYCYLAYGPKPL